MTKSKRLGRGLSALIPENGEQVTTTGVEGRLTDIEVGRVKANPYQPRLEFDRDALEELKASIKEKGVIQPITVRKVDKNYELISGERRLRAVAELGHDRIPAYIIEVETKEDMLELALIENVQREKLNSIEQATAFKRLIDECNLTQDEVAQKIGKERSTITNMIRLLKLPKEIQDSVKKDEITMGHARTLLAIDDAEVQKSVWKKVIKNSLSVRRLEKMIKNLDDQTKDESVRKPRRSVFIQKVEDDMRELLGTKVNVRQRKEGGSIEIEFYSPEDLNRLLEIFEKIN